MPPEIDPIQFGRLLAAVEHLTDRLEIADSEVAALNERLAAIEGKLSWGKGWVAAMLLVAGFALAGLKDTVSALLGR